MIVHRLSAVSLVALRAENLSMVGTGSYYILCTEYTLHYTVTSLVLLPRNFAEKVKKRDIQYFWRPQYTLDTDITQKFAKNDVKIVYASHTGKHFITQNTIHENYVLIEKQTHIHDFKQTKNMPEASCTYF
jgi:hypothetical protein